MFTERIFLTDTVFLAEKVSIFSMRFFSLSIKTKLRMSLGCQTVREPDMQTTSQTDIHAHTVRQTSRQSDTDRK